MTDAERVIVDTALREYRDRYERANVPPATLARNAAIVADFLADARAHGFALVRADVPRHRWPER